MIKSKLFGQTLPFMATAIPINAGHSPEPPPPASINPQAAASSRTCARRSSATAVRWIGSAQNICNICEEKTPLWWWIAFIPAR